MQTQLLRVSEFCDRYAVSRATFYRLVKNGDLTLYKIGCASRVRLADAEAWLASIVSKRDDFKDDLGPSDGQ